MTRTGVSPVLAFVLLTGLFVTMGASTYIYLQEQQILIEERTALDNLDTVNMSCGAQTIDWWLENTGNDRIDASTVDIAVYDDGGLNISLSRFSAPFNYDFQSPGSADKIVVLSPAGNPLKSGGAYTVELDVDGTKVRESCTAGGAWFDVNWDHRRPVIFQDSGAAREYVELDTKTLIQNQKLQPDCDDLRVVNGQQVIPYEVQNCDAPDTNITIENPGTSNPTYLYYDNIRASNNETTLGSTTTQATLLDEERNPLPG